MASITAQDWPKIVLGSAVKTKQKFTKDTIYAHNVEPALLYLHTELELYGPATEELSEVIVEVR